MTRPIGIAVVGCGYWGVNYCRVFNELAESRVVTVCDPRGDRLREVARHFPGVQGMMDVEAAVTAAGVDAAVVATTASTHYDVAERCLKAGKHALVEKPLTTRSEEAGALGTLAEARSLVLMVGHTFIYNGGIRKVKEYVDDGLDRVYYVYARRTNLGPIRHDVNAVWDLASHDIAIFNYLLDGPPKWVSAVGAKVLHNCREDVGFISLGYRDDVVGHIHVSWADPHKTRELVVVGADRRIAFNDMNALEQVRVFEKGMRPVTSGPLGSGEDQYQIRDGDILSPRIEVGEPLKNQCRHFLECVVRKRPPLTGAREGRDVVQVLEAVDRSIALRGAPVAVNSVEVDSSVRHPQRKSA